MVKKRTCVYEDLVDIVALFPWWVGVVLAMISYIVLQPFAHMEVVHAQGMGEIGKVFHTQIGKTLATIGQYLLPAAFLLGAVISFVKRKEREYLFESSSAGSNHSVLNNPSWKEFELLVGEAFRRQGYSVHENGGGGSDGGVDLVISRGDKTYLVQCKQWKTQQVGVKPVRELAGVVATKKSAVGIMVTSGSYTNEAKAFARDSGIQLIDGKQLHKLIKNYKNDSINLGCEPATPEGENCPQCGSVMVQREAKRGRNSGKIFWGCSRYPVCRGTRDI